MSLIEKDIYIDMDEVDSVFVGSKAYLKSEGYFEIDNKSLILKSKLIFD